MTPADTARRAVRAEYEDSPDRLAAEVVRLRRGWLLVIQQENQCAATGVPCDAKRCGCVEERELCAND